MTGPGPEPVDPDAIDRLVHRLLRLYPAAWRERYGAEFAAVLGAALVRGRRPWPLAVDVVAGALDAHRHPENAGGSPVPDRIRNAASISFLAFVAFVVAGAGFAKMSEDPAFSAAARAHGTVGSAYAVVYGGAVLAGLAVLAGGLPALAAIARQALAGRTDLRRLLLVPPLAVAAWAGLVAVLVHQAGGAARTGTATHHAAFLAMLAGGVLAAGLSAGALVLAARRAELPARLTRLAAPAMTGLGLAMAAVSGAGLAWGLALRAQAPALFHSDNGLVSTPLPTTWAATVAVMAGASLLAAAAAVRAVRLARTAAPRAGAGTGVGGVGGGGGGGGAVSRPG